MELVRGLKVTDYCDQNSLTTAARLELFTHVCDAVQHAHQKGIAHRDIKPSNILVSTTPDGRPLPKVIDFGIAKATTNQRLTDKTLFTEFEMLIGTPAYMSPEQAALTSVEVDTRTDIYSLGVLLYELLTGTTPFDTRELLKADLDEVRRVIRNEEPVRPSTRLSTMVASQLTSLSRYRQVDPPKLIREVRGDLDWIVMKALEKDPCRRYATANGLAADVKRYAAGDPISARPPSRIYRFQKLLLRNKLLFGGIAVLAGLLVTSLVLVSTSLARERRARLDSDNDKRKAQQVTRFLEDMLQGVGPSVALGRDTTMLREILDKTAAGVDSELTNQPAVEAELKSLMGRLYLRLGEYSRAEQMDRAATAIQRTLAGPESLELAASLNELSMALLAEGSLSDAEDAAGKALGIRRRRLGENHPDVAASLNNLGSVYRQKGRLKEAKAATQEALAIRQRLYGTDNLDVADSLRSLGIILGDEGSWADAESKMRQVLAIRRKLLPSEHPWIASALTDVAWAAGGAGNLDEAESLEREALTMRQKILSPEHPDIAKSLYLIGDRLRQRGNLNDACPILTATLSVQRKLLGEDSPATLDTMHSLALALAAQHKLDESERMSRQALALWRKREESDTPRALYTLSTLAETLQAQSKWAEAEQAYREVLSGWRKRGELESPSILSQVESLSRVLVMQKRFSDAETLLDEALTPAAIKQPSSANLLIARAGIEARHARWHEAAADAALSLDLNPAGIERYSFLAALLARTHNRPSYEQFCNKILTTYSTTTNMFDADQVAKACLFLPSSQLDLRLVSRLADTAVTLGARDQGAMPLFCVCKALSEYRLARYAEAADWARKSLSLPRADAHAHAHAVLAMAEWQLGHQVGAQESLAKGEALAPADLPPSLAKEPDDSWVKWLFARVSLDEASELIKPGRPTDDQSTRTPAGLKSPQEP
jgi:tetratricopeptide (TPR) repeat protein